MTIYRWLKYLIVFMLFAGAAAGAHLYLDDPIHIQYGQWEASPSALIMTIMAIVFIIVAIIVLNIITWTISLPAYITRWRQRRSERQQQQMLMQGLHALAINDDKQMFKAFSNLHSQQDGIFAWLAAQAAEKMENTSKQNIYLQRATESNNHNIAVAAKAKLAMGENNIDEAFRILSQADITNNSPLLATMYLELAIHKQQWSQALKVAYHLYSLLRIEKWRLKLHDTIMQGLKTIAHLEELNRFWKEGVASHDKQNNTLLTEYIYALHRLGDSQSAQNNLSPMVKNKNTPNTADTLQLIASLGTDKMCEDVFTNAKPNENDANHLAAMAMLAERLKLSGKARRYYQMAYSLRPSLRYRSGVNDDTPHCRQSMNSAHLFNLCQQIIPGGVNSPVRAFRAVGGKPIFFARGKDAILTDVDGNDYIDYVCSWGAIITGHANDAVVTAVQQALRNGLGFGTPTDLEYQFAHILSNAVTSIEMVRAVNSGTEATMSAIRLARGWRQRDIIIKFDGCYHGHADALLVAAGSGSLTLGKPSSIGVPNDTVKNTLSLPYNDSQAVSDIFKQYHNNIAAVIVEPIAGNMNMVRANREFLLTLRQLTEHCGAVLIFDEVMSGFRVAAGGAQQLYEITPDITCLGKVIGGGLGVAAFGGRKDIMQQLSPLGNVYQAGTLSGNPIALTAGINTLNTVLSPNFYERLHQQATTLTDALTAAAKQHEVNFCADAEGGMMGFYFRPTPPQNFNDSQSCDIDLFKQFFHAMLARGIYLAPSAYEAGFITSAHNASTHQTTVKAVDDFFAHLNTH